METTFIYGIFSSLISETAYISLVFFFILTILNIKTKHKKKVLFVLINAVIGSLTTGLLLSNSFLATSSVGGFIQMSVYMVTITTSMYFILKHPLKISFFATSISLFTIYTLNALTYMVLMSIFGAEAFDISQKSGLTNLTLMNALATPLIALPFIFWSKRMHIGMVIKSLCEVEKKRKLLILFFFLMPNFFHVMNSFILYTEKFYIYTGYILLILFTLLIVLIPFYAASKVEANKEKIKAHEAIIIQQELYVKNLEKLQQDMRVFKHDYQNMLAGMYLHVEEGKILEIQDFLKKASMTFDHELGMKINQTSQLANVEIIPLKSLLITKLMKIYEKGITSTIEVLYPIKSLNMPIDEVNRCLGILIDNAIEAVEGNEAGIIHIIITHYDEITSFKIINTILEKPNLQAIWEEGYSTKGENRGLGLFSYEKTISPYSNVSTSTCIESNFFIQEMKIQE